MKQTLKRELIKQGLLLCMGVFLLVSFLKTNNLSIQNVFDNGTCVVIGATFVFYPLGFVYGWREIFELCGKMWNSIYLYFGGTSSLARSIILTRLSFKIFFAILALALGWVIGVYKAVKILIALI